MAEFTRRLAAAGLLIGCLLAAPSWAETAPPPIGFVVKRDGGPIGTHRLTFHTEPGPDGERLIVDIDINIVVRIASVTIYRYTVKGRETWRNGRLLALDTATDDDGTKKTVRVRATDAGLQVDATNAHYLAPPDTLPESYWRLDTVKHQHFIDIEDGTLVDLFSTPAGRRTITVGDKPVEMNVYHVEGDITGELGYGTDGQWMLLHFPSHGSDILYTREP
jgi:Family of unknown function (DUF6134)